ncbi:GNAT family N-acetyltransferase [uncultured Aquitalea sp.]|uniref:GNAT family N-acetyltransferase n=1 Tax=uncultured Aquitalea sp. TaxID=540272 RepID=UPI0025FCC8A2|nr:GNAT family N-acetyltransferase [uncultured Aquitalea sp.]
MPIQLLRLSLPQLQAQLADAALTAPAATLPPHVLQRAVDLLQAGGQPLWCAPCLMVRTLDGLVVGACGFKGPPRAGVVEIGYAVEPAHQGQGLAKAAVRALLAEARGSAEAPDVCAAISPDNAASLKVAQALGFRFTGWLVDAEGERLMCWRIASQS